MFSAVCVEFSILAHGLSVVLHGRHERTLISDEAVATQDPSTGSITMHSTPFLEATQLILKLIARDTWWRHTRVSLVSDEL